MRSKQPELPSRGSARSTTLARSYWGTIRPQHADAGAATRSLSRVDNIGALVFMVDRLSFLRSYQGKTSLAARDRSIAHSLEI